MNSRTMLGQIRFTQPDFRARLDMAKALIAKAMHSLRGGARPFISFSGGKDSAVVLALVLEQLPDCPVFWFDDELEYPETVEMMEFFRVRCRGQFRILQGASLHGGWFRPWEDRPFFREPLPGTIFDDRCKSLHRTAWFESEGFNLTFLGTRGPENRKRMAWLAYAGPIYYWKSGQVRCCPLWNWSSDDVWAAIGGMNLGYNRAYDRFEQLRLADELWRVGPLPLVPRRTLADGWPDLLTTLESRYGRRWAE